MNFSSSKEGSPKGTSTKDGDDLTINSDTFRRWKEASMKNDGGRVDSEDQFVDQVDRPEFVTLHNEKSTPLRSNTAKTADWPEEEAPIRIVDDSVMGVDFESSVAAPSKSSLSFGAPAEPERKIAAIGSKASSAKSAGSKFAQFVSGLGGSKSTGAEATTSRSESVAPIARTFNAAVPGSSVQSQALNTLGVEERKQLFKEEEQLRSAEDDIRHRFGANLKSALSSGTIIEGKFKFDSPVRIDGTLMGEVQASSLLIVGGDASVDAKVKVGSLVVLGVVKGNIEADELVEVKRGGILEGDVKCARFAIEEGGWFQGKVTPTSEPKPRALAKKVEKIAEPAAADSTGNVFHQSRSQSEQLSLGDESDIPDHATVKASWSN